MVVKEQQSNDRFMPVFQQRKKLFSHSSPVFSFPLIFWYKHLPAVRFTQWTENRPIFDSITQTNTIQMDEKHVLLIDLFLWWTVPLNNMAVSYLLWVSVQLQHSVPAAAPSAPSCPEEAELSATSSRWRPPGGAAETAGGSERPRSPPEPPGTPADAGCAPPGEE